MKHDGLILEISGSFSGQGPRFQSISFWIHPIDLSLHLIHCKFLSSFITVPGAIVLVKIVSESFRRLD